MKAALTAQAKALGFSTLGVTAPDATTNAHQRLKTFLDDGSHGDMDWLANDPARRADPLRLWSDVRSIIRLRRMRDRFFRSDLFADPAWDMLLDLMAARLERVRVAVSSLCIAAAVPPTTALRWIKTMSDNGMFVRVADPEDGRRVFIELSDEAASGMAAYLSAAKAAGGLAI